MTERDCFEPFFIAMVAVIDCDFFTMFTVLTFRPDVPYFELMDRTTIRHVDRLHVLAFAVTVNVIDFPTFFRWIFTVVRVFTLNEAGATALAIV
jgi:hypothetical protein